MPDRNEEATRSPDEQVRALYEDMESRTAKAFEEAVSKPSFGALLARSAENIAALSRMGNDFADLVLRNLRVAGRADVTRLARQLHRTEDKLEQVLQEVEQLRDELAHADGGRAASSGNGRSTAARRRRSSSAKP
jgi:ABC-type transporter Mla subunit MlaD